MPYARFFVVVDDREEGTVAEEKQTEREQEREQDESTKDLDLPDETAEGVKGGQAATQKVANQKWTIEKG
jgi:hypothetical protein